MLVQKLVLPGKFRNKLLDEEPKEEVVSRGLKA